MKIKKMPFVGKLLRQTLTYAVIGFVVGSILVVLTKQYATQAQMASINSALASVGLTFDMLPIVFAIILYVGAAIQVVTEWRAYNRLQREIKDDDAEIAELEAQLKEG